MTDHITALRALLAKVEAGWPSDIDTPYMPPFHAVWPSWRGKKAWDANNGSLDAAKALHDDVLPGWEWHLGPSNAKVYPYNGSPLKSWSGMADNPARAWLLAIIRALIE